MVVQCDRAALAERREQQVAIRGGIRDRTPDQRAHILALTVCDVPEPRKAPLDVVAETVGRVVDLDAGVVLKASTATCCKTASVGSESVMPSRCATVALAASPESRDLHHQ